MLSQSPPAEAEEDNR
jgi:hypothetical protein